MLQKDQDDKLKEICLVWPEDKPGGRLSRLKWFGTSHSQVFDKLLGLKPSGVYLELGCWTGAGSTEYVTKRFSAMSVICVDTFEGSSEHHRNVEQKAIADDLWRHFCVNRWVDRHRVYPIKATSVEGMRLVKGLGVVPDFIYVDAAHEADAVFDDVTTALSLFPTSVIIGDDYVKPPANGSAFGVYAAIDKAVKQKIISPAEFRTNGRVWYLTRNLS